jgi:hypothetical protein
MKLEIIIRQICHVSYVVKAQIRLLQRNIYIETNSQKTNQNARYEVTNKCVEVVVEVINAFQILPQHVSEIYCHHQGVIFTSESTQAICVVDVYGLQFVQCGRLSRDATTKSV